MHNTDPNQKVKRVNEAIEKVLSSVASEANTASAVSSFITTPKIEIQEGGGFDETDYLKNIPLDRKVYKQQQEVFGRRITPSYTLSRARDSEGRAFAQYTTKVGSGELTFRFLEDIIKQELGLETTEKLPSLGRRGQKMWISMIYFARKQGEGIQGNFTASELMRLWEVDPTKQGRAFADIRETFINLATLSTSFTNKRRGDDRAEWGFAFISSYYVKGEGKEARYFYSMTPEALGMTEKWLAGELTIEQIKHEGGYIGYPLSYIKSQEISEAEANFRDRLLAFKGGYTLKAYTILTDWLKLRPDLLRRQSYCHGLLREYLENAKVRGDISGYTFEVKTFKDWKNKWTITIYKPEATTMQLREARRGEVIDYIPNGQEQQALIDRVLEWMSRPIQNIKTPPSRLRTQITNTVARYGVPTITRIYNETANGAVPSVHAFWQEIKKLKASTNKKYTSG